MTIIDSANALLKDKEDERPTRKEAEKAAQNFNCTGAHEMGDKWMPCATHEAHKSSHNKNKKDHNHHHHH